MNKVRLDPRSFIPLLWNYLDDPRFDREEVKEAMCILNENQSLARTLPELLWNDGLALAA
jgi:hypothetical protein